MDTAPAGTETEDERGSRIAREAAGIARAREDVAAGRVVEADVVDAWIDSVETVCELDPPSSGR